MLCNNCDFEAWLLGEKQSRGEARHPSTGALSDHVMDNEEVDTPNHNNIWHNEESLIVPS